MTPQGFNRATAAGATGAFLIISVLLANLSTPERSDPVAQRPSTHFADPTGVRALLLIMRRLLPAAEQWRRPFYRFPTDRLFNTSSLIVVDPEIPLSKREYASLKQWLTDGGQLILLSHSGWSLRDRRGTGDTNDPLTTVLSRYAPSLRWTKPAKFKVEPAKGSSIPAADIKLRWRQSFAGTGGMKTIASADNQILAVEIRVGQGRIVAIADPTMASNAALRRSDNAVWLVSLVAGWGAGRALFDEYHHGFGDKRGAASLAWAFTKSPWGWCLWQLAAAGLLYILIHCRRFGRISEPPIFEQSNPVDLVDSRAGIFQAARAQRLATQLVMRNLSQDLSRGHGRMMRATGINADPVQKMATQKIRERFAELQALEAKTKRGERLTDREFIQVGRLAGELIRELKA